MGVTMKFLLATIGMGVLLLCMVSPAVGQTGPNLVVNGSFETDPCTGSGLGYKLGLVGTAVTGWVIQTTDGTYPWCLQNTNAFSAGPAADGNQWLVLGEVSANTSRTIQQTLTGLNPGGTYKLSFAISSEEGCCSVAEVSFPSGSSTVAQTFTAPAAVNFWKPWATVTMNFIATSSSVTLQFKNLVSAQTGPSPNGFDLGLDNVSVTSTAQNQATNGAQLTINGMLNGAAPVPVFATITDSQIHSGSFQTVPTGAGGEDNCTIADQISTDAYAMQAGAPTGCDPGDTFEGALGTGSATVSGFAVTTKYVVWTAGPAVCNTKGTICIGAGNPSNDTSFMTVTNNNTGHNFTGTIGLAGTPLNPSACLPSGTASDSKTFNSDTPFLPGDIVTFAISTDASACGGFQPTQIAPPQTVAAGGTNPVVFNNAANNVVQHNVTWAGNLTPQNGVTNPQLSSENIIISTDPTIAPYLAITPWAVARIFEKAGDNQVAGGTGFGSIYRDKCFQAGQDPSTAREQDCPIGTGPTDFTNFSDTFDQPTKQDIAPGTTVSLIHHPGTAQTGPQPTDTWLPVPSGALINPVCKQVQTSASGVNFDCELADDLIYDSATISPSSPGGVSGDQTTIGGKRGGRGTIGSFFMVPMLTTTLSANGKLVNTPGVQGSQVNWFNTPNGLNLNFLVNPATTSTPSNGWFAAPIQSLAYVFFSSSTSEPPLPDPPNCVAPATTTCHATSGTPGAFTNGVAAAVNFADTLSPTPSDGLYTVAFSARDTVKIGERNIQLLPLNSPTPCPPNPYMPGQAINHPCYSTTLFSAQIGVDTKPPTVTGLTLSTTMPTPGQMVTASYTCNDELSGIASCGTGPQTFTRGTLNTGTLNNTFPAAGSKGLQSFPVTATDLAGNNSAPTIAKYTVVVPDVNGDGTVGCDDLAFVKKYFGTKAGQPAFNSSADVNGDGVVNVLDLSIVASRIPAGTKCP